jgi:hypothetical protein
LIDPERRITCASLFAQIFWHTKYTKLLSAAYDAEELQSKRQRYCHFFFGNPLNKRIDNWHNVYQPELPLIR